MNKLETALLREAAGDAKPRLTLRSETRIDTGRWGRTSPLWICVMEDELILLAVSRRHYLARVPLAECRDSRYCQASGEFVIDPCESLEVSRFEMSPANALKLLNHLVPEPRHLEQLHD